MTEISGLTGLFVELNNLKRVRAAQVHGSLAENLFRMGWSALIDGIAASAALCTTASALARIGFGAIDGEVLRGAGLTEDEAALLELSSFDSVSGCVEPRVKADLRKHLTTRVTIKAMPEFVDLMAAQPRAGATRPRHARVIVLPQENHAEHSLIVGLYGVLLAPQFRADPNPVFLAALSHHLHNAYLPDAGFAGEELLGSSLESVMCNFRAKALAQLTPDLASSIRSALSQTAMADNPEGKAFHAADVLDRVLQMKWHEDSGKFTLRAALEDLELIHAGPVREFQMKVLQEAGLC